MIVADTGPLVAALDRDDRDHVRVAAFLADLREPVVVPTPVLYETCFFVGSRLGAQAEAALLRQVGQGRLRIERPTDMDYERAAALVERYGDWPLGAVDGLVCAIAERLGTLRLLSFDHRHFAALRPAHGDGFELLP
jgi:predicted nucleic acid-binding protein